MQLYLPILFCRIKIHVQLNNGKIERLKLQPLLTSRCHRKCTRFSLSMIERPRSNSLSCPTLRILPKFARRRYFVTGNLSPPEIQYNLNGLNTDGSFTMDDSNSFFSPYKFSSNSSRKQIFRDFFLILSWNCMLCVLIRIASSRRF